MKMKINRVRKRNWCDKKIYNNKIALAIEEAFTQLDINMNDENFQDTPRRLTQFWEDFTYANTKEGKEELKYLFTRKFKSNYKGMVVSKDIVCYSLCPHHFSPIK